MSEDAFENVCELYRQLACERAGRALAELSAEGSVERLFAAGAQALEDAAGVLLYAATTLLRPDGSLRGVVCEQAGALLAVAGSFEQAADLSRSREPHEDQEGGGR